MCEKCLTWKKHLGMVMGERWWANRSKVGHLWEIFSSLNPFLWRPCRLGGELGIRGHISVIGHVVVYLAKDFIIDEIPFLSCFYLEKSHFQYVHVYVLKMKPNAFSSQTLCKYTLTHRGLYSCKNATLFRLVSHHVSRIKNHKSHACSMQIQYW